MVPGGFRHGCRRPGGLVGQHGLEADFWFEIGMLNAMATGRAAIPLGAGARGGRLAGVFRCRCRSAAPQRRRPDKPVGAALPGGAPNPVIPAVMQGPAVRLEQRGRRHRRASRPMGSSADSHAAGVHRQRSSTPPRAVLGLPPAAPARSATPADHANRPGSVIPRWRVAPRRARRTAIRLRSFTGRRIDVSRRSRRAGRRSTPPPGIPRTRAAAAAGSGHAR